jgi:hypothetical protein
MHDGKHIPKPSPKDAQSSIRWGKTGFRRILKAFAFRGKRRSSARIAKERFYPGSPELIMGFGSVQKPLKHTINN